MHAFICLFVSSEGELEESLTCAVCCVVLCCVVVVCVQSPEVFDLMIAGIVVSITNPSNSSSTRSSSSSSSSSSSTTCSPPFFENVIVQPAQ